MSDNRNELLAQLRDAVMLREWLQRKLAADADQRIADLVRQLRGYGVERVFTELEANPPEQTKQQRGLLLGGWNQSTEDGKHKIVAALTPTLELVLLDNEPTSKLYADWAVSFSERADPWGRR